MHTDYTKYITLDISSKYTSSQPKQTETDIFFSPFIIVRKIINFNVIKLITAMHILRILIYTRLVICNTIYSASQLTQRLYICKFINGVLHFLYEKKKNK